MISLTTQEATRDTFRFSERATSDLETGSKWPIGALLFSRSEKELVGMHLLRYSAVRKEKTMAMKEVLDKLSIYIPERKRDEKPVQRLIALGEKRDRSVNYLVVEAILQYLEKEEKS